MWGVVATTSLRGEGGGECALCSLHQVCYWDGRGESKTALGLADVVSTDCFHANLCNQLTAVVHAERLTLSLRRKLCSENTPEVELTFSRVQVQDVQGEILLLAPRGMSIPSTLHLCAWGWLVMKLGCYDCHDPTSSFHRLRLTAGRLLQGTLSFRNSWYWSKTDFWILSTTSQFSQMTLARVIFLISAS